MTNTATARFEVPFLLSFDAGRMVMGRGEAGWTVVSFGSAKDALSFALSVPVASRTRAHQRIVSALESSCG